MPHQIKNRKHEGQSWFYHAPERPRQYEEPIAVPPSSQIPGLNGEPVEEYEEEPRRGLLKDTDSDYVRMAKMGGRPDLLKNREPKVRSEDPVGYPRPDWFYLEDNREQDEQERRRQQQEWQFLLPDYMVHDSAGGAGQAPAGSQRSAGSSRHPFVHSEETAAQREGDRIRDKTVRIEEHRRQGYGVRSAKMDRRPNDHGPVAPRAKAKGPQQELPARHKYLPMAAPAYEQTEKVPMMSKLMSHAYVEQWHDEQTKWRQAQDQQQSRAAADRTGRTEYQESMLTGDKQPAPGNRASSGRMRETSAKGREAELKDTDKLEKELFKLSKFRKVPARVDSRRPEWFKSGPGEAREPGLAPVLAAAGAD